jgi:hypothetical protein
MRGHVIRALVAIYRANSLRPHCDRARGRHAWTCRLATGLGLLPDWCEDLPGPIGD